MIAPDCQVGVEVELERLAAVMLGVGELELTGAGGTCAWYRFRIADAVYVAHLVLPHRGARAFTVTMAGKLRTDGSARRRYEEEVRRRWRAWHRLVSAKVDAILAGAALPGDEFHSEAAWEIWRVQVTEGAGR